MSSDTRYDGVQVCDKQEKNIIYLRLEEGDKKREEKKMIVKDNRGKEKDNCQTHSSLMSNS